MIAIFKKKKNETTSDEPTKGFFTRLKEGLKRTRNTLAEGVSTLVLGKKTIDDELIDELEMLLLSADIGVEATRSLIDEVTNRVARKELTDPQVLLETLKQLLLEIIAPCEKPLVLLEDKKPFVILFVGINGAGKTTTIGKLAKKCQAQGKKVLLAAGDTFRAAAIEQLQVWGERNDIPVIAQQHGADSAAVIFDAVQAAKSREYDVVIADTAGRLHTQEHLMNELEKVSRVMKKLDDTLPHETFLVLDAGTGQNAIHQAKQFNEATNLTGIILTKLDGTAKGGVIFAIAKQMGLPIPFIGIGESVDDLREFDANAFVEALFDSDQLSTD